jgi:hypothetical protein
MEEVMESIVLVGYFGELFASIKKQNNYYKIIILEKATIINPTEMKNYFDEIIQVDNFLDKIEMSRTIENIMCRSYIKALYAAHEWVVEICGYLREKYSINGINEMVAKSTRDKFLMKTILSNAGIKTAKVQKVKGKSDVEEFALKNRFPVVVKPQSGAATQNTFIIRSNNDIEIILSKLNLKDNSYIVETFTKGEEYHCDSIVVGGKIIFSSVGKYLANCIDTVLGSEPVASIIYPSQYSNDRIIHAITNINEKVISELKISSSVCHMEVFVTEDGEVVFGEIATRIGGGPLIGKTIRYGYGMDIYDEFIKVGLDESKNRGWKADKFFGFIALPTKAGKIIEISSKEDYEHIEWLKEICILNKVGDNLEDNYNTTKRCGYIIVEAESYDVLKERLIEVYNKFDLVVKKPKSSLSSIY